MTDPDVGDEAPAPAGDREDTTAGPADTDHRTGPAQAEDNTDKESPG